MPPHTVLEVCVLSNGVLLLNSGRQPIKLYFEISLLTSALTQGFSSLVWVNPLTTLSTFLSLHPVSV